MNYFLKIVLLVSLFLLGACSMFSIDSPILKVAKTIDQCVNDLVDKQVEVQKAFEVCEKTYRLKRN